MKKVIAFGVLVIISLTLIFTALLYSKHEIKTTNNVITISNRTKVRFEKYNLTIRLKSIVDNTCPKDVTCIRAGEIIYNLDIVYNNNRYNKALDSDKNKSITIDDITISIKEYTDDNVTLLIEKK